ncbi:twin-arginine translocation signal domain-containing protein, partial [Streptomyces tendae]
MTSRHRASENSRTPSRRTVVKAAAAGAVLAAPLAAALPAG